MMKLLKTFILGLVLIPSLAFATPVSWDLTSNVLQPLKSAWTSVVKGYYFTATSTTATSTFPLLTSTNAAITGKLYDGSGTPGTSGYVLKSTGTGVSWVSTSTLGLGGGSGTVTSVAMTVPTGLSISGSPITTSGTLALSLTSGYSIPVTNTLLGTSSIDTSAELAAILTNETGTGNVVFSASPTFTGNMTIANASSTNMSIATGINLFGGGYKTTANALCIQLTGSSGLCDGTDDGGAGGSPAGSDTYVQYNNGGSFGAVESSTNGLRWVSGSDQVLVGTTSNTGAKLEIDNTNSSFTSPMFSVFSNSTSGANADLLIQSPDADIEFCRDGITSPADCFEITSSAGNNSLFFTPRNASDSSYEYPALTIKRLGSNDYGIVGVGTQYDTPGATLEVVNVPGQTNIFAATSDLSATEGNRFVVAENGMVGIGNTSPNVLLSLATTSGSASHNFLKLENTGAFAEGGAGLLFNNSAGTIDMARLYARPGSSYTDASLIFSVANSSKTLTERMRIDVNGRLGIATTTPAEFLSVDGNIRLGSTTGYSTYKPVQPLFSVTLASTSNFMASGGTLAIPAKTGSARDIVQYKCHVEGGTSVVINVTDGTNDTETITCATTQTSDNDVATNSTFTADELWYLERGTVTGTVNYLVFEALGYVN